MNLVKLIDTAPGVIPADLPETPVNIRVVKDTLLMTFGRRCDTARLHQIRIMRSI